MIRRASPLRFSGGSSRSDCVSENTRPRVSLPVRIELDPPQELNHSSYVVAGLFALKAQGLIHDVRLGRWTDPHRGELQVDPEGRVRRSEGRARKTTFFTVHTADGRHLRVAMDFRDSPCIFPVDGLERCDFLFKRSYQAAFASRMAGAGSASIRRAGLSFALESPANSYRRLRNAAFWFHQLRDATRIRDRRLFARAGFAFKEGSAQQRAARSHGRVQVERHGCPAVEDGTVMFQTRTFNRTDDADANQITEQRANLIRALRAAFGDRFVGGFVPDALTRRCYADCISNLAADKKTYFGAMRTASVVVSSRGLVDSPPWKLSEYLGTGRCIVSERLRTELDVPLRHDGELMFFDDVDTCVGLVGELLAELPRRQALGRAASDYFAAHVDPLAGMYRVTKSAVEHERQAT